MSDKKAKENDDSSGEEFQGLFMDAKEEPEIGVKDKPRTLLVTGPLLGVASGHIPERGALSILFLAAMAGYALVLMAWARRVF